MTTWLEYLGALEQYIKDANMAIRRKTPLACPPEFLVRPTSLVPVEYLQRVKECERQMQEIIDYGEKRKKEILELLGTMNYLEKNIPAVKGKIITTVI